MPAFNADPPAIDAVPVTRQTLPTSSSHEKKTQVILDTTMQDTKFTLEENLETPQERPDVSDSITGSMNGSTATGEAIAQSNSSTGEKIRSHNLRLVLKPLPIEDDEESLESETSTKPSTDSAFDDVRSSVSRHYVLAVPSVRMCMQRFYSTIFKAWCDSFCIDLTSSQHLTTQSTETCAVTESVGKSVCDQKSQSEGGTVGKGRRKHCQRTQTNCPNSRSRPRLKLRQIEDDEQDLPHLSTYPDVKETSIFDYIEPDKVKNLPTPSGQKEYPLSYHSLAFLPYNPLPEQLEKVIFPSRTNPLAAFDDPYWPAKGPCLALVQEVRENPHIASFPGTFLPPAARGAE